MRVTGKRTARASRIRAKTPGERERMLRKDGTRILLEFTVVLVRDEAGALLGPAAILREGHPSWEREKATKERLAILEGKVKKSEQTAS